jgi:diaminopimelate decarboxylase
MAHLPQTDAASEDPGLRLTIALDQIRDAFDEFDDPRQMFVAILDLLITRFQADGGAIVLLDERADDIEGIVTSHLQQGEAIDLCRAVLESDRPTVIDNPYWNYALGDQIALRGQPLGAMVLVRQQRAFSPDDMLLLSIAERQIDSAIVQARMIWKLAAQARELNAIHEANRLAVEAADTNTLVQSLLMYVQKALASDFGAVFLGDSVRPALHFDRHGLSAEVVSRLRVANDGRTSPLALSSPAGQPGLLLISVPLVHRSTAVGQLIVGREALFTSLDQNLLSSIAEPFAAALASLSAKPSTLPRTVIDRPQAAPPFDTTVRLVDGSLFIDDVCATDIAAAQGTPTYVYSQRRIVLNLNMIREAFPGAHIHYSVKSNNDPSILRLMASQGVGADAVSAGEIHLARRAKIKSADIVFAGVGKTGGELFYAVSRGIGWFNIENPDEARLLNAIAAEQEVTVRAALRFNPAVEAKTHRFIATGHRGAKFGMPADAIHRILQLAGQYPNVRFEGIHMHIGSQLEDTSATREAVIQARDFAAQYSTVTTLNIGGGIPAAYDGSSALPSPKDFADAILPAARGFNLILEPGRFLVAAAGVLLMRVLYVKDQGMQRFVIVDAGMNDLIRPMLYQARHAIVPLVPREGEPKAVTLAGPVCESTDILAEDLLLPPVEPGDVLAVLTAGAYGAAMASNYNARMRPAEVVISEDGRHWSVSRRREEWEDLLIRDEPPPA